MAGSTQEEVATTQQTVVVTSIVISFSNSGRSSYYHVHDGQQGCRDAPIALVEYNEFHKQIVDKVVPSKFVLFLKEFCSFNIVRVFYVTFSRTCFSTLIYSNVMLMYRNVIICSFIVEHNDPLDSVQLGVPSTAAKRHHQSRGTNAAIRGSSKT